MPDEPSDTAEDSSHSIPMDALPDPVAAYAVRDDGPVIERTNARFDATFDGVHAGLPIRQWWTGTFTADDTSVEAVCSALANGEPVDASVLHRPADDTGNGRYRLRSSVSRGTATDEDGGDSNQRATDTSPSGYLVVTPIETTARGIEVERIASVVSHDLRNPLDVATAHRQAARETGDPEHFDRLARAHDRMERIIQDVLTLARGEGAVDPSVPLDVGSVAADAWATVDTDRATLVIDDDLPTAEADADRLQRLFENLFRNSVEHARRADAGDDDGRVDSNSAVRPVEVRVEPLDDGFAVADDGRGIPAGNRDRVFTPGFSTNDGGTGLGLTIVERIAEAHGWTVSVRDSTDGGARFEFSGLTGGDHRC